MAKFRTILKGFDQLIIFFPYLSMAILFLMMLITTYDVIGREIGIGIPDVVDLIEWLMVLAIFPVIAYAQLVKRHITVDILTSRITKSKLREGISFPGLILSFAIYALTCYYGFKETKTLFITKEVFIDADYLPKWIAYFAIPLGSFLMCIQLIKDIHNVIKTLVSKNISSEF